MDIVGLFLQFDLESWLRAAFAVVMCAVVIPAVLPLARRLGMVDHPGGRKQHDAAIPVIGGLVIFIALALTHLSFESGLSPQSLTFIACAGLLVVVGQLDDLWDLHWSWRIAAQATAALMMIYIAGLQATNLEDVFGFTGSNMGLFAVPFTVFIVVGVINALNMADGVDGLAGSLSLVSLMLFTAFALYGGDLSLAERLLALCGSLVGFLLWNARLPWQPRARVFLGNGGSMLLGFVIAWTSVRLTQDPAHPVSPVLGPWTLALPLIDCVTLMIRRWRQGKSPFAADRHHMHHMLLDAGFSPTWVVLILAGTSLALGIGAAVALKLGIYRPLLVLVFLALLAGWYVFSRDYDRAVARLRRYSRHPDVPAPETAREA
ncbi:MraY family glycosyltransferase [Arenimonas sp. MALMAid1274]|uniref:MraY family glycosyltransferase n=1 Tax=Arenimonas sp. MALMAid1274 TaxID=3411630 RepID=UPI003BA0FCA3